MSGEIVIALEGVSVRYGSIQALEAVTGHFHAGSLTAVAGPNGAGKSTLLKVIAGLVAPSTGRRILAGGPKTRIGYLPQMNVLAREYPLSVPDMICTGFWREAGERRALTSVQKAQACEALALVGLEGFEDRRINELSGGQFQRMLFARLWVQNPDILLLDEPFAGVDSTTTARLMQLLLEWYSAGKTVVCVLHDLLLIKKYFPESFVLAGKCLGRGHTHEMFEQKLLSFDLDMAEIFAPGDGRRCDC